MRHYKNQLTIKCDYCGKEFTAPSHNYLYCCAECKAAGHKKKAEAWRANNPDKIKQYQQRQNEKEKLQRKIEIARRHAAQKNALYKKGYIPESELTEAVNEYNRLRNIYYYEYC